MVQTSSIFIALFGFGIAFVGSLKIQYSLTKILIRYKYLQIFVLYFLLILTDFLLPDDNKFLVWILFSEILTSLYLLFHTFLLIDKMYDPEEVILEVIAPMIVVYENAMINNSEENEKLSLLYSLKEYNEKDKQTPLAYNPIINNIAPYLNAELENFDKSIARLIEKNNFKLRHFVWFLDEKISSLFNSKQIKIGRSVLIDFNTYRWFLITRLITQIVVIAENDKKYQYYLSRLLTYLLFEYYLKNEKNYKLSDGKYKFGNLTSEFLGILTKLDIKEYVLFCFDQILNDKQIIKYVNDKDEQIIEVCGSLIFDFVTSNFHKIDKVQIQHIDLQNFISILNIYNSYISKIDFPNLNFEKKNKKIISQINTYLEFVVFTEYIYEYTSYLHLELKNRKILIDYYKFLINIQDKNLIKELIKKKFNDKENLTLFRDKKYYEKFEEIFKNLYVSIINNRFIKEDFDPEELNKFKELINNLLPN